MTLAPVLLGIMFVAGMRMRWLAIGGLVAVLLSPIVWMYVMKDYQRERVTMFLDPSRDPKGKGLQQIQAKVAVGSGADGQGVPAGSQGAPFCRSRTTISCSRCSRRAGVRRRPRDPGPLFIRAVAQFDAVASRRTSRRLSS